MPEIDEELPEDDVVLDDEPPEEFDDEAPEFEDDEPPVDDEDEPLVDDDEERASAPQGGQQRQDQGSRAQGRGGNRIQRLSHRATEAEQEAARLRRELDEVRSGRRQQSAQEAAAQERERLALMTPEERLEYRMAQQEERHRRELAQTRFEIQDQADRQSFEGLCARSPIAARMKDKVESKLREIRATGQNVNRETMLAFLIGENALRGAPRAQGKQQRRAEQQRQQQQVRPGNRGARSDVAAQDRRSGSERDARAKRLEDQSF